MCGICGIVSVNDQLSVDDAHVREMTDRIAHRGPDGEGAFHDRNCFLAMRRLAIIDIANGNQPIYSYNSNSLVFFNGEIYNHAELRRQLSDLGIPFHTHSDTEVIVNAYECWGEDSIVKLRGMFAFCIYDLKRQRWIWGRDRFGEKPLYYFHRFGYLSFSSELGSLLSDKNIPRRINKKLLPDYLTLSYVQEPHTLIESVSVLPAGHFMVLEDGHLTIKAYIKHEYSKNSAVRCLGDAVDLVRPVFENSVRRQMVADVPLGAFLSGGIDSSTVVATMQKFSPNPIRTFTVRFQEQSYDESPVARDVSNKLGTVHHEITLENSGFTKDLFWELVEKISVPFPDSSAIPSYYVAKEIRKHVKVALSGDGGDELFAGYALFHWYLSITRLAAVPARIRRFLLWVIDFTRQLPGTSRLSLLRKIRKAVLLSKYNEKELPIFLHALFAESEIEQMAPGLAPIKLEHLNSYPQSFDTLSQLRKIMHFRLVNNLPLDMLTKIDRTSMANSLEVRAPFLDADLFEVASSLPDEYLMNDGVGKVLLREMMKDELPKSVFDHPKKGFSIPLHKFQNKEFYSLVDELLVTNKVIHAVFDRSALVKLVKTSSMVRRDNVDTSVYSASHKVWSLLQLAGWIDKFKIIV